jgi:hypothetical protein
MSRQVGKAETGREISLAVNSSVTVDYTDVGGGASSVLLEPGAVRLDDLRVPPGNRLHKLGGDRAGQHAIAVNDQWRICFRFVAGDAYNVEITDYH